MAAQKVKAKKAYLSASSEFESARARIRRDGNVRLGLARYRYFAEPEILFQVGGQFATHAAYRSVVWPSPFPARLSDLPKKGSPYYTGFQKELAWAAGTIRVYAAELNEFLKLKQECEQRFLISDLGGVEDVLNVIQSKFGQSLWLIDQKITHLLQARGYREKTDFVSSVLGEHKAPSLIRYATTWLSYRSLAGVSAAELERFLDELIPPRDGFDNLTHLIMGRCLAIDEEMAGAMIWEVDNLSVIDRYLLLISTLQVLVATNPDGFESSAFTLTILTGLADVIDDRHLRRLAFTLGGEEYSSAIPESLLSVLDEYSSGFYDRVLDTVRESSPEDLTIEIVHIGLRAGILSNSTLELKQTLGEPRSLISSICTDLAAILNFSDEGVEANLRLQKLVLTHSGAAWASSLAAILERQRHDERAFHPTPRQTYHGLRAHTEHPLLGFSFNRPAATERFLRQQLALYPESATTLTECDLHRPRGYDWSLDLKPHE
jgi:hypothetical protein